MRSKKRGRTKGLTKIKRHDKKEKYPEEAKGFLVYDTKKCAGCHSCMLACSVVHEGKAGLSSSRIQIIENRLGEEAKYPTDIDIAVCMQCKDPSCMTACPVGAIYVDKEHLNVRKIDEKECTKCKLCITACHFKPSRIVWNPKKENMLKCDLCRDTPFWNHEKGKTACIEVCPVKALKLTTEPPASYDKHLVNLRGEGWKQLDLPVD